MRFFEKLGGKLATAAAVVGTFAGVSVFAEDGAGSSAVTLPNIGIDMSSYATTAITELGAVVAVVVGGIVAFMLVRAAIRWIRSMK